MAQEAYTIHVDSSVYYIHGYCATACMIPLLRIQAIPAIYRGYRMTARAMWPRDPDRDSASWHVPGPVRGIYPVSRYV